MTLEPLSGRSATVASATTHDGLNIHVEDAGQGIPVLFIHEFAGNHRSWEPQVRAFSRRYRCVTYAARGYPPSDVPDDVASYSQDLAVTDAIAVLDHLGIDRAHVVGLSMGGFTSLYLALRYPGRARSAAVAGVGRGGAPAVQGSFRREAEAIASAFHPAGAAPFPPPHPP